MTREELVNYWKTKLESNPKHKEWLEQIKKLAEQKSQVNQPSNNDTTSK